MREHTDIPVPHVYAWNADASNPVGVEYIIMEKASGVQLFRMWDKIDQLSKLALIQRLTKWESQLMTIRFPTYGSLYPRNSFPESESRTNLPSNIDPSESYCIGGSCDPTWSAVPRNFTLGPCMYTEALAQC